MLVGALLQIGLAAQTPDSRGTRPASQPDSSTGPAATLDWSSRGQDRVVSAKDDSRGLSGGKKVIRIGGTAQTTYSLSIVTRPGGGTATIELGGAQYTTTQVARSTTTAPTVIIKGGDISTMPRDVMLTATPLNSQTPAASWDFTVFRVDLSVTTQPGKLSDAIPTSAKYDAGKGPRSLLDELMKHRGNLDSVGQIEHCISDDGVKIAFGNVVITGTINPSGMIREDFNLAYSRDDSFNLVRRLSARTYDQDRKFIVSGMGVSNNISDDLYDDWEDLKPNADRPTNDLFIWATDSPSLPITGIKQGDTRECRIQFVQGCTYAGEKVAADAPWFFRTTQVLTNQNDLETVIGFPGDNQIGAGTTDLTYNLGPKILIPPTLQGFTPATTVTGFARRTITVQGTGLNQQDTTCALICSSETRKSNEETEVLNLPGDSPMRADTAISADFVFDQPREYIVTVIIDDQAFPLTTPLVVTAGN